MSTGIITTVAGGGRLTAVDNVAATLSTLKYPSDVAVDTFGNIYIADRGNRCIRKVTASTGIITSITGNNRTYVNGIPPLPTLGVAATASSFPSPTGLFVDMSGNVFFTESNFNSIYKITASTGIVTLVAGTNSWNYGYNGDGIPAMTAFLHNPTYLTFDRMGNIFFVDQGNRFVRKITASTGIITIVAGTLLTPISSLHRNGSNALSAVTRLSYLEGIAVDAAGTPYFCDGVVVMKVTYPVVMPSSAVNPSPSMSPAVSSGSRAPIGTATSPQSLKVTPTPLGASDSAALSVTPGFITVVAGSAGLLQAGDMTIAFGIAATSAKLYFAVGLAVDQTGNLYITTADNYLRKVTVSTGIIAVVAGTGYYSCCFSHDGTLASTAMLNGPEGIAVDRFGNIFVADSDNDRIRKITVSTGIITTVAGGGKGNINVEPVDNVIATSTILTSPRDVALDTYGNIYIAGGGRVRKVTASTGIITTIAGKSIFYSATTPTLGVAATANYLANPTGVTVDSSGNVFYTDRYTNSIYKITASTGLLSLVAGNNRFMNYGYYGDGVAASTALLNDPRFIEVDAIGNLYFADTENHRIRKVNASTGVITTVAGQSVIDNTCVYVNSFENALLPSICRPRGIAFDTAGNVYFGDNRFVRKIKISDADLTVQTSTARHVTDTYSFTAFILVTLLTFYFH